MKWGDGESDFCCSDPISEAPEVAPVALNQVKRTLTGRNDGCACCDCYPNLSDRSFFESRYKKKHISLLEWRIAEDTDNCSMHNPLTYISPSLTSTHWTPPPPFVQETPGHWHPPWQRHFYGTAPEVFLSSASYSKVIVLGGHFVLVRKKGTLLSKKKSPRNACLCKLKRKKKVGCLRLFSGPGFGMK